MCQGKVLPPAPVVRGPGGHGGSALSTGQHAPVQEGGEAGLRCTPAGLPALSMAGQSALDSSPVLSAGSEGLAVHKGPPTPGGVSKPGFIGPFEVEWMVNPTAVRLKLPPAFKKHPTFHVSKVKPVGEFDLVLPSEPPPPPRVVDGGPAYTVRSILDIRRQGRRFQFLVDCEGYSPEARSWVLHSFILDNSLLRDFYRAHLDRPGRAPVEGEVMLGSRVPGRVFLWSGVFLPAGGVEEPILATAGAAGSRTCRQSISSHLFKHGAPCLPALESYGVSHSRGLHATGERTGLENAQDLNPVLAPRWSSPCTPEDWTSASLWSRRTAKLIFE
ncbi:uncharacterized protein [Takifugu rubripes]|uniref:uncharacterized protein n=1 Tax=Takifugu rubripes TaxID=31033 RepID=UPI001145AA6E|nr:uncharacterized protein LOC115251258 [Takifugu rubripes]